MKSDMCRWRNRRGVPVPSDRRASGAGDVDRDYEPAVLGMDASGEGFLCSRWGQMKWPRWGQIKLPKAPGERRRAVDRVSSQLQRLLHHNSTNAAVGLLGGESSNALLSRG
jgi:hypothetical protein